MYRRVRGPVDTPVQAHAVVKLVRIPLEQLRLLHAREQHLVVVLEERAVALCSREVDVPTLFLPCCTQKKATLAHKCGRTRANLD